MSKKCADCGCEVNRNVIQGMYYCPRCDDDKREIDVLPMTIFDCITQSPEVLAPYCISTKPSINGDTLYYYSTVTSRIYLTENEAIAATVEKMKEVKR